MNYAFQTAEYIEQYLCNLSSIEKDINNEKLNNDLEQFHRNTSNNIKEVLNKIGYTREEFEADRDCGDSEINRILKHNLLSEKKIEGLLLAIKNNESIKYIYLILLDWFFEVKKIAGIGLKREVELYLKYWRTLNRDATSNINLEDSAFEIYIKNKLDERIGIVLRLVERLHHLLPDDKYLKQKIIDLEFVLNNLKKESNLDYILYKYQKRIIALRKYHFEKTIVGNKPMDDKFIRKKCHEALNEGIGINKKGKIIKKQVAEFLIDNSPQYSSVRGAEKALNRILEEWYLIAEPYNDSIEILFKDNAYYISEKTN